jgi:hypothetical protein
MSAHPPLFPTFSRWYRRLSHLLAITPVPVRIALFPTIIIVGSLPVALIALFSETNTVPRAYELTSAPQVIQSGMGELMANPAPAPQAPQLQTKALPPAIRHQLYLTTITSIDTDLTDHLATTITGLPRGLNVDSCQPTQTIATQRVMHCTISGKATDPAGTYPVSITLTDSGRLSTRYMIDLAVVAKPSLLELF